MGKWRDFPLPDGSYSDDSRPWTQQDVINYLPTFAEQSGTRSRIKYKTAPGLRLFSSVGNGPHRGGRDVEGKCFVVSGTGLYLVSSIGDVTLLGAIPGTGPVSMTHNQVDGGNQLVIGTGDNSYVYDTSDNTFAATGVPLQSVDFLDQVILGVDIQRRFWRYSDLADAKSYPTTQNESAESSPDRIVGGCVSQGEWLVFGERTIEPWTFSPTDTGAFQRNTGAIAEKGCINANTIKRLDNSVFFVDNNNIPCRLQGYAPIPIAPKAIIDALAACDPLKMFSYTWEDAGYVVYYITCQDGQTWGYDVTSQKWHRRESFGLDRWRLNTLFKWNGDWYGGDYSNGNLYRLTWGYVYEGCEIMPRRVRTGVTHNNGNRVFVHGIRMQYGIGGEESLSECRPCSESRQYDGGQAIPATSQIVVGEQAGYLDFAFATGGVPDKAEVYIGGVLKLDTGWWGDPAYQTALDAACALYGLTSGTINELPVLGEGAYDQWNNGNAVHFAVAKTTTDTLATVKVFAPMPSTAWKFQLACPSVTPPSELAIAGDVPDGAIEDSGTMQYTVTGGAGPYTVALISGSLPPGAVMDATGLVTYTYTTGGFYSWAVRGTDTLGNTVDLNDTAAIGDVTWFSTAPVLSISSNRGGIKSPDGADWMGSRNTNLDGAPIFCGGGKLLVMGTALHTSPDVATTWVPMTGVSVGGVEATGGYTGSAYLMAANPGSGIRIFRALDGVAFSPVPLPSNLQLSDGAIVAKPGLTVLGGNASIGGNVATTTDHGASFNGLYEAFPQYTGVQPDVNDIATDNNYFLFVGTNGSHGYMSFTLDGQTFVPVANPFTDPTLEVRLASYGGGTWMAVNAAGEIATSTNRVVWTLNAHVFATDPQDIDFGGGRFIIVGTNANMETTVDYGVNWSTLTNNHEPGVTIQGITAYRP